MSDGHDPDESGRIFRAALPGWQSVITRRRDGGAALLFAPGRRWLEASVLAAAVSLLVPSLAVVAVGAALLSRRAGNSRWLAALLAALWCGLLGTVVRGALGIAVVP
jgi:hypothetical protein